MAWIVQQAGAVVIAGSLQETLVGNTIMEVFARMDLITEVYSVGVKLVQDRQPVP
jgi:hypothetical protein